MKQSPFQTLSSKEETLGRFKIIQDVVMVNNHKQPYDYLKIKAGVSILAFYNNEIIIQRQFRYPVNSWQWEIPGGFIDLGETPEQAAIRELKEETGYNVDEITSLSSFHPSFGSTNEIIYLFLAKCSSQSDKNLEYGEVIETQTISIDKMHELVKKGEFMHGAGLAAWARYLSSKF